MKVDAALQGVTRLFLDTAPVIYYIEKHPNHVAASTAIFNLIDQGAVTAGIISRHIGRVPGGSTAIRLDNSSAGLYKPHYIRT